MNEFSWSVLMSGLSIFLVATTARFSHWSVAAVVASVLLSCRDFTASAMVALVPFLLLLLFVLFTRANHARRFYEIGNAVYLLSVFLTLTQSAHSGITGNASMNGCLIAILWPVALKCIATDAHLHKDARALAISIAGLAAILITRASIPLGVIGVVLAAFAVGHRQIVWLAFALTPLGLGVMLTDNPDVLFDSSGRFAFWREVFNWWVSSNNWLLGNGLGSFQTVFGLYGSRPMGLWAHNDFLQILFEQGLVGLASVLVFVGFLIKRVHARPWLFASVMGYLACAFFNFPLHAAPTAALGCGLLWCAYSDVS